MIHMAQLNPIPSVTGHYSCPNALALQKSRACPKQAMHELLFVISWTTHTHTHAHGIGIGVALFGNPPFLMMQPGVAK